MLGKCSVCGLERECTFTPLGDSVYDYAIKKILKLPDAGGILTCAYCDSSEHPMETDPEERAERMNWLFKYIEEYIGLSAGIIGLKLERIDRNGDKALVELSWDGKRKIIEGLVWDLLKMGRGGMWLAAKELTGKVIHLGSTTE